MSLVHGFRLSSRPPDACLSPRETWEGRRWFTVGAAQSRKICGRLSRSGAATITHFAVAGDYERVRSDLLSQAELFRLEGIVAIGAAALLLVRPGRVTALFALLVSGAGAAAVLAYTYVDPGALGPLPDMYEPVWFLEKVVSLIAQLIAVVAAGALVVRGIPARSHRAPGPGPDV